MAATESEKQRYVVELKDGKQIALKEFVENCHPPNLLRDATNLVKSSWGTLVVFVHCEWRCPKFTKRKHNKASWKVKSMLLDFKSLNPLIMWGMGEGAIVVCRQTKLVLKCINAEIVELSERFSSRRWAEDEDYQRETIREFYFGRVVDYGDGCWQSLVFQSRIDSLFENSQVGANAEARRATNSFEKYERQLKDMKAELDKARTEMEELKQRVAVAEQPSDEPKKPKAQAKAMDVAPDIPATPPGGPEHEQYNCV